MHHPARSAWTGEWRPALRRLASLCLLGAAAAGLQAAPKVEDSMAQRVQACTGCHGKEGRAASDGYYPRIAGKPARYLHNQLLNFREGRRRYALMTALLEPLSDEYLREIADHFSSLDLPYAPQQPSSEPPALLQRGQELAMRGDAALKIPACVQCHGQALTGVAPAIPGLLGLPRDYVVGQLAVWKSGSRRAHEPDCMAQIAQRLGPGDIGAVARWLAAQPVPSQAKPAASLPAPLPMACGSVVPDGATR